MPKTLEIPKTLTIDAKALKDYQTCARLYNYRYIEKQHEYITARDLMVERYENTFKKVLSFYFYKKQGGIIPSYSALLNRWERLWFPKEMTAYDIAVDQHESAHKGLITHSADAAMALLKFKEDFAEDPYIPVMIDEDFIIPLKREIRLKGSYDLVLKKGMDYRIISWYTRGKRPPLSSLVLDFSILKYSFDQKNRPGANITYQLYDLGSSKPGFINIEVRDEDINTLKYWANQMWEDEIYPSRRDVSTYCKRCQFYDNICASWSMPTVGEES